MTVNVDQIRAVILNHAANAKDLISESDLQTPERVDEAIAALRDAKENGPAARVILTPDARYRVAQGIAPQLVAKWDTNRDGVITLQEVLAQPDDFRRDLANAGVREADRRLLVSPIVAARLQGAGVPARDDVFEKAMMVFMKHTTPNEDATQLLLDLTDMAHTETQRERVQDQAERLAWDTTSDKRVQARAALAVSASTNWYPLQAVMSVRIAAALAKDTTLDTLSRAYAEAAVVRADIDHPEHRDDFINRALAEANATEDTKEYTRSVRAANSNELLRLALLANPTAEQRTRIFAVAIKPAGFGATRDLTIAAACAVTETERQQVRDAARALVAQERSGLNRAGAVELATFQRRALGALAMVTDDTQQRQDVAKLAEWYSEKMKDQDFAVMAALRSTELALRPPSGAPAPDAP